MSTVSSWHSPKTAKGGSSAIAGRGLFAAEPIAAGEVVAVKGGHVVETATMLGLAPHLRETDIQIAPGLHLVALTDDEYEGVMLRINHSCEPNLGVGGNVVFCAMRDIAAGEELTVDYALFDRLRPPMACRCGTPSCRGTITGDDARDPALRARYEGWFAWHLAG